MQGAEMAPEIFVVGSPGLSKSLRIQHGNLNPIPAPNRFTMPKYKLEYIWLDGYNADGQPPQQDADQGEFPAFRRSIIWPL